MNPRFSIVIPTRNRASLARAAIESALAQTHHDFEVVVSDNSDDDATERIVASIEDERLQYVRTSRPLSTHDSWRFASRHARGTYVTFLGHEDAYHPRLLNLVARVADRDDADVIAWGRCGFRPDAGSGAGPRVQFRSAYTDCVHEIDGAGVIDAAFEMRVTHNDFIPRMLNTAVKSELLERAEAAGTPSFRPACPDRSATLAMMLHARRPRFLDAPLSVTGSTSPPVALDPGFVRGLLSAEPDLVRLPAEITVSGWIAQTYAQCASEFPPLSGRSVNLAHTYGIAGLEIERWRERGVDVSGPLAELEAVLAEHPDLRAPVETFIATGRTVETDRFVGARCGGEHVLGLGPFAVAGGGAAMEGPITRIAAGLDPWLAEHARPLVSIWDEAARRAKRRSVVIYGLGNGGRSLCRARPGSGHPLVERLLTHDDGRRDDGHPDDDVGLPRLDTALDPRAHFVLVTPIASAAIARRLTEAGFEHGSSWATVVDLAEHGAPASVA